MKVTELRDKYEWVVPFCNFNREACRRAQNAKVVELYDIKDLSFFSMIATYDLCRLLFKNDALFFNTVFSEDDIVSMLENLKTNMAANIVFNTYGIYDMHDMFRVWRRMGILNTGVTNTGIGFNRYTFNKIEYDVQFDEARPRRVAQSIAQYC